jgi:hypothetical protein
LPYGLDVTISWGMGQVQQRRDGESTQFLLDGRPLTNGAELELRLGANQGWESVTVTGLPQALRVRWTGEDGQTLQTTLPPEAQVRWA